LEQSLELIKRIQVPDCDLVRDHFDEAIGEGVFETIPGPATKTYERFRRRNAGWTKEANSRLFLDSEDRVRIWVRTIASNDGVRKVCCPDGYQYKKTPQTFSCGAFLYGGERYTPHSPLT
jgi:hypothetical protein